MSGKRKTLRIIALIFALLFFIAAILQYNDPDPFIWMLFYGTAAVSCLLFFVNRFPAILGILLGLIYLGGTIWIWPLKFEGVSIGTGDIENIERGREALGLLITALVMFLYAWQSKSKKS